MTVDNWNGCFAPDDSCRRVDKDQRTNHCRLADMAVIDELQKKREKTGDPNARLGAKELRWTCRYPVMDGGQKKYKPKKFRLRKDAEDFERKMYAALDDHNAVDQAKAHRITVGELHREYMDYLRKSGGRGNTGAAENSLERYEKIYKSTIKPRWDMAPLSTVTAAAVRDWVERGEFPTQGRKTDGVKQFNRLINYADGRYMNGNPVKPHLRSLPKSEKADVERHALTLRQVFRLSACAVDHYAPMFEFLALTGLRFGELAALRGCDIDGRMLNVRRTQRTVKNRVEYAEVTKNGERRTVPLTWLALDIAEAHRRGRDEYLFTAPRGGDLIYQGFANRGLKPALALAASAVERLQDALGVSEYRGDFHVYGPETVRAVEDSQQTHGLPVTGYADPATRQALGLDDAVHDYTLEPGDTDYAEDFTPHGFRHTCVSLVVGAGANVKLAQRFAGHASASMTLDTYSHLFDENLEGVADALGKLVDEAQGISVGERRALTGSARPDPSVDQALA
jgi:integrase